MLTESTLRNLIQEPPHRCDRCFYCGDRSGCYPVASWWLCYGCIDRALRRVAILRRIKAALTAIGGVS